MKSAMTNSTPPTDVAIPPLLKNMNLERWICNLLDDPDAASLSWLVCPQGSFYRSYKEDILSVTHVSSGENQGSTAQEVLRIDVSREGLYDMLPEGLFHESIPGTSEVSTDASVQQLEQHRQEEREARKFFLPLEQEFYRQKIFLEYQEQHVFQALAPGSQAFSFLRKIWNVPSDLPILQKFVFLYLGPHLHRIAGNLALVQQCLALMLQAPVRIEEEYHASVALAEDSTTRLGEMLLGDCSVLGDTLEDPWPYLLLTLGPLSGEQLLTFLQQAAMDRLMHFLAGYLFTMGTEYEVQLTVQEEDQPFVLQEEVPFAGRLGYTTYLT